MCTALTDTEIIDSFCNPSASLRIVCATIAFGMGIDCADVCEVIHFGVKTLNPILYSRDRTY